MSATAFVCFVPYVVAAILLPSAFAATFPGNARVEINDPTGALTITKDL